MSSRRQRSMPLGGRYKHVSLYILLLIMPCCLDNFMMILLYTL